MPGPLKNSCMGYCPFTFLEFEPAKIVADDAGHRHLNSRGEVVLGHLLLELRRLQNGNQLLGEIARITNLIEPHRHIFIRAIS